MIGDNRLGPVVPGLFDFSILFEQSILSLLPAALFILLSPFRIYWLLKRQTETRSQALLVTKEVVIFIYLVFQATLLGLWVQPSAAGTKVSIAERVVGVLEAITIAIYSYTQHLKSVKQSWLLNGYLMLSLLFDAAQVRTYWLRPDMNVIASVFSVSFAFKATLVILEELPKKLIDWEKTSPRETRAGIVSRSIFWWLNRFLLVGFRTIIGVDHIGPIDEEMDSRKLLAKLQAKWEKAPKKGKHVLVRCVFSAYKSQFFMGVVPRLCFSGFTLAQPFLQKQIIRHVGITDKKSISEEIGGLIGATALVYVGLAITGALYKHATFRLLTMFRGSIVSMVYQKTLRLDAAGIREAAPVSLMSTDVERAVMSADKIHDLWASFLELPAVMYILARQVGAPAVFAVVPSLITTGGTLLLTPMFAPAQAKWNAAIQKRVGETSSMLSQIKASKMMGLMEFFGKRLQHLRKSELDLARPFRILQTATTVLHTFSLTATPSSVIIAAIFWTKADQGLSAVEAFTALTTIAIATSPLATFLAASKYLASSLGSFGRIEEFLLSDTYEDCRQIKACQEDATSPATRSSPDLHSAPKQSQAFVDNVELSEFSSFSPDQASETLIEIEKACFQASKDTAVLHDISMKVRSGTLSMIVGRVGCGKSSLLRAVAGEIAIQSGTIKLSVSSMAYCSQKPWLKNISVRDNILGQSEYDEAWFASVTKACALNEDIEAFSQKEHTLVGTGGVSLSGGQQQRVALARAVYSRKKLAVIDDAFSGLDNTTAKFVFQALFGSEGLLRRGNQTVVLVTNNVNFLSSSDCITMLDNGRIMRNQVSYNSFEPAAWGVLETDTQDSSSDKGSESDDESRKNTVAASAALKEEQNSLSRALGDWQCYKIYAKSIGIKLFITFLVINAVVTVLEFAPRLYIKYWTEAGTNTDSRFVWLGGYIAIDVARWLLDLVVTAIFFLWSMPISAQRLHSTLLKSVLRAPLYFFTSTDSGNTLNRFSQDMSLVDQALPLAFFVTLIFAMEAVMTIALIVAGASYSAISFPFAILTLYFVQKYYLRTSRQIRLLDLEFKTPLYTQFSETLAGLSTIRAFGWSDDLIAENYRLLDASQRPFYTLFCIQRWLNVVLDLFAAGMAVLLVSIALYVPSSTSQGAVGVSLVTLIQFNVTLSTLIRYWTELETSLGAIARLKWFVEKTSDENRESETESVSSDWPARGEIELANVTAAYSDGLDPVLHDITLKIQAGQKVGICGRSGSGKSSLIATLLRLLEVTPKSTLTIDNANLTHIPRQTIRSHITALPQDPFHISGTVRFNLDPEGTIQADEPLIRALQKTSVWSIIEGRGGLDAEMDDLGFSVGQMQLFCLARVLLRRSKVLLLDEATSSVDRATDDEVREAIRADLEGRTVVEVAHRVEIVRRYDVVVAMAEGRIVEVGSPDELLEKQQGLFRGLWESR